MDSSKNDINRLFNTQLKPCKKNENPLDKYVFVKMIDAGKNVSVVRNTIDGKDYIQKEYKQYNQSIFERLKKANINGTPHIYECEKMGDRLITIE